jgi:type IX secretion system PorP/SprF family membrane protein
MKKIFFILFLLLCSLYSTAQNRQFNHLYMLNPGFYNPSNMDIFTKYGFTLNYLNDFVGSTYSPLNFAANGYYNARPFKGFGGSIINDNFGAYNQLEVSGNASYKIFSRDGGGLSHAFGIRVGFLQKSLNTTGLRYESLSSGSTDPVLGDLTRVSSMGANLGVGYSFITNKIDVNVSLPYFFGNRMPFSKVDTIPQRSALEFGMSDFFITAGYKHRFDNDWYVFYPTLMLQGAKGAPIHAGVDLNFLFSQLVWASVGFRSDLTMTSSVGVFLDQGFRIVYSYQNALLTKHNGTGWNNELSIGYARTIPDNPFNYKKFTTTTGDVKKAKIFKIKMPRMRFIKKIKGRMKYD